MAPGLVLQSWMLLTSPNGKFRVAVRAPLIGPIIHSPVEHMYGIWEIHVTCSL